MSETQKNVLIVLSSAQYWTLKDGTKHPTGFWAEEFVVPFDLFTAAGFNVTVASPRGETPVADKLSLGIAGGLPPKTNGYKERLDALKDVLENTVPLADAAANHKDYDLVFYPGGHGPMEDLVTDKDSAQILNERLAEDRLLALLCHAPAALLATVDGEGKTAFAGRQITSLSNVEELMNPFAHKAKWLLEDRLVEAGMNYNKAKLPFRPFTIVDGSLHTGQNPQSSKKLAMQLIEELQK